MSGERGIAVNRRTLFQKHHNRDLPSLFTKLPVRVLLLSVLCAMMSILCFQFLMQWEQWFYLQLVKRGMMFSFQPEKIMEEIQEKAKDICFYEVDRQELIELLELDKYDDGYTYFSFYDGDNGGFQFSISKQLKRANCILYSNNRAKFKLGYKYSNPMIIRQAHRGMRRKIYLPRFSIGPSILLEYFLW